MSGHQGQHTEAAPGTTGSTVEDWFTGALKANLVRLEINLK